MSMHGSRNEFNIIDRTIIVNISLTKKNWSYQSESCYNALLVKMDFEGAKGKAT